MDMLSLSSHKIYGPKGVGALFIRAGLILPTYIHGGAQESRKRAGTENIPAIVGFGKAAEIAKRDFDSHVAHVSGLRDHFVKRVLGRNSPHLLQRQQRQTSSRKCQYHLRIHRRRGDSPLSGFRRHQRILGFCLLIEVASAVSRTGSHGCSGRADSRLHPLYFRRLPTMEDQTDAVDQLKKITERLREISSISEEKGW